MNRVCMKMYNRQRKKEKIYPQPSTSNFPFVCTIFYQVESFYERSGISAIGRSIYTANEFKKSFFSGIFFLILEYFFFPGKQKIEVMKSKRNIRTSIVCTGGTLFSVCFIFLFSLSNIQSAFLITSIALFFFVLKPIFFYNVSSVP